MNDINTNNTELTDQQIKEIEELAIASGSTTREKIEEAARAQEIETERYKQHVFEYQRYTDLAQVVRSLLMAMKKLNSTGNKGKIAYWANAVNSWVAQAWKVLENKELFNPPLTKQLIDDLYVNIDNLRRLKSADLKDINLLIDDVQYRLLAMYGSLVTLEGIKQYAIEARHSAMVEYIQDRIKIFEDRAQDDRHWDRDTMNIVIAELRGLIYHDNQKKDDVK